MSDKRRWVFSWHYTIDGVRTEHELSEWVGGLVWLAIFVLGPGVWLLGLGAAIWLLAGGRP